VEGIYSVTFTSDLGNGIIATKIQNAVSRPNAVEPGKLSHIVG
jgi:hypothetical protein